MHKLAHSDGEVGISRAAANMKVPMILSSYATTSLEDVKAQSEDISYMMQMFIVKDRNITLQLLQRVESKYISELAFRFSRKFQAGHFVTLIDLQESDTRSFLCLLTSPFSVEGLGRCRMGLDYLQISLFRI